MTDTSGKNIVVVDDDPLFRESLGDNLRDDGYVVADFEGGEPALDYLNRGEPADLVVLDWRMPGMTGLQVLRELRSRDLDMPVIFLTVLGDQVYEEAALNHGAVDFVEKSRSLAIIKRRIALSLSREPLDGQESQAAESGGENTVSHGNLTIDRDIARAYWKGVEVPLTLNEVRIVDILAGRAGKDVRYRELYDQVHGAGFVAGSGEEGHRGNVRTLIKRIRTKFRNVDPAFDAIENYPGFGYRWRDDGAGA
nr:response regulator transcription factor [Limimonas halophila]